MRVLEIRQQRRSAQGVLIGTYRKDKDARGCYGKLCITLILLYFCHYIGVPLVLLCRSILEVRDEIF